MEDAAEVPLRRVAKKINAEVDDRQPHVSAGRWLQASQIFDEPSTLPILILPYPIACLIVSGVWDKILLLSRWHVSLAAGQRLSSNIGVLPGWPPENSSALSLMHVNLHPEGEFGDLACEDLSLEFLETSVAQIRAWSQSVPEGSATWNAMKTLAMTLDSWHRQLLYATGIAPAPSSLGRKFGHDARKMVDEQSCLFF